MFLRQRVAVFLGGLIGAIAVALSAVASHASDALFSINRREMLCNASRIELLHAVMIVVLGLSQNRRIIHTSFGFILGTILFCVSVDFAPFGWVSHAYGAPIGGFLLMASWLYLSVVAMTCRAKSQHTSIE